MGRAKTKKTRRTGRRGWVILLAGLGLALAAGLLWLGSTHVLAGGRFYPRSAQELDLRERKISTKAYETLREKLPECEILWSVPLGGDRFDCTAESIAIASFSPEEAGQLAYFTALTSLDATAADLTPELFETLQAAAPDCYIRWSIPIGSGRYPSDAAEVEITDFPQEELERFLYFDGLETVDARACTCYQELMALRELLPDTQVLWQVPLSGETYLQDAEEILVDGETSSRELAEALEYLPAARVVSMPDCPWTEEEKLALAGQFPEIAFCWPVSIRGQTYASDTESISLAGTALAQEDVDQLMDTLCFLPELKTLDLTGCGLSNEQIYPLCDRYPQVDVVWTFQLYGVDISTLDTFIDFTGIPMETTQEVEDILPYMHFLEKVDMSDCGFSDEEMDALNKAYPDVRFVWTLHITYYDIRTDDITFRATSKHYGYFTDETVQRLRYCTDMIVLDLGHRPIGDLSFLYDMPNVKYLCLLDCRAQDLTPIGSLKQLVWLELNRASAPSIAPLVECTSLRDLNITFMSLASQEDTYETLMAMPWLERVWFSRAQLTTEQEESLREANPDWIMYAAYTWVQSNANPWRFDQDYYDMRDLMGMFYMDESGWIDYKIIDGVRYDLSEEFLASQQTTENDRDR